MAWMPTLHQAPTSPGPTKWEKNLRMRIYPPWTLGGCRRVEEGLDSLCCAVRYQNAGGAAPCMETALFIKRRGQRECGCDCVHRPTQLRTPTKNAGPSQPGVRKAVRSLCRAAPGCMCVCSQRDEQQW